MKESSMKKLTLIICEDREQALSDCLRNLPQVQGFTFINVEGHGAGISSDESLSAHDQVMGYRPQVRADLLLNGEYVETVLAALGAANIGLVGHTFYWVTPTEKSGSL